MPKKPPKDAEERQVQARELMEEVLKAALQGVKDQGHSANVYFHSNRDGSVDGELFVKSSRGRQPLHLQADLRRSMPEKMPVGFWVSTGARFEARRDEDNYYRHKSGLWQAQTFYQRYTEKREHGGAVNNMPGNFLTGQVVAQKVVKSQRKKVDGFFVRLHWNAGDTKPGRAENRKDRKPKRKSKGKSKTSQKSTGKGKKK